MGFMVCGLGGFLVEKMGKGRGVCGGCSSLFGGGVMVVDLLGWQFLELVLYGCFGGGFGYEKLL